MNSEGFKPEERLEVLEYVEPKLWRYLSLDTFLGQTERIEAITGLSDQELHLLEAVHFLLSEEVTGFLSLIPNLMRNLSHSTHKEVVECRSIIRGRIDWSLTFKERFGGGYNDPSLFMCKPASKMYDLPENQLLKFLINTISNLSYNVISKLDPSETLDPQTTDKWFARFYKERLITKKVLGHAYFQSITLPNSVTSKMLIKSVKNRNKIYKEVVNSYKLYEDIFINENSQKLEEIIKKQILEPLNDDKLFEIYVLFKVLDLFKNKEKLEFGLLKPNENGYLAEYKNEKHPIKIYYQHTPDNMRINSNYKDILNQVRIPDIILEIGETNPQYIIIEVKRLSTPKSIRGGLYKVLGYLEDFQKSFNNKQNPKAILVVWEGINIQNHEAKNKPVWILKHNELNRIITG